MGSTPTSGTNSIGAWLSLVERSVRDAEVGGSNPLAPTMMLTGSVGSRFFVAFNFHLTEAMYEHINSTGTRIA